MESERRIGVVGSRKFQNYKQISDYLDNLLYRGDCIVSGGAVGVDSMAQRYAREHGFKIVIFYPDYHSYGRGATFVRNKQIAGFSDHIVAFYARGAFQQGGTANTIEWARKLGKPFEEFEESDDTST